MIQEHLQSIYKKLPSGVTLVAVSKFHPVSAIQEAYDAGQRVFAESRPQELSAKVHLLPKDIQWHFIGHLQTNKLKMVLPFVSLVQSVDSLHLLEAISSWAVTNKRVVDVLLELHLGAEETKQGFSAEEILEILPGRGWPGVVEHIPSPPENCFGVRIRGLMGMATNTEDVRVIEQDFVRIEALFKRIQEMGVPDFDQLSIGMSGDWPLAVQHGATMVRIGTDIFGPREY